jgi:hypothetical protein
MVNGTLPKTPELASVPQAYAFNETALVRDLEHDPTRDSLSVWLLTQAGITSPLEERTIKLLPDGFAIFGKVLIEVADRHNDTSSGSARAACGVVESLTSRGLATTRKHYTIGGDSWIAGKLSQFRNMMESVGEDLGPKLLRGKVLSELATASGISLAGAEPTVDSFGDIFEIEGRQPDHGQSHVEEIVKHAATGSKPIKTKSAAGQRKATPSRDTKEQKTSSEPDNVVIDETINESV